jgi:hypothetical protein
MASDELISIISRYFFFILLDGEKVFRWTSKAWHQLSSARKRSRDSHSASSVAPQLISIVHKDWQSILRTSPAGQPYRISNPVWKLPEGVDFGSWLEFRRQAEADVIFTVVGVKLIGFSIREMAAGLGVSEGTIMHRLGKGVRQLTHIQRPATEAQP